jgi:Ca-activated chloride channel family protein
MGLTTAVNRKEQQKQKQGDYLLTDGVNNAGFIEPETAADIAKQYGIKVYTGGIGTNSVAGFICSRCKTASFIQMIKIDDAC